MGSRMGCAERKLIVQCKGRKAARRTVGDRIFLHSSHLVPFGLRGDAGRTGGPGNELTPRSARRRAPPSNSAEGESRGLQGEMSLGGVPLQVAELQSLVGQWEVAGWLCGPPNWNIFDIRAISGRFRHFPVRRANGNAGVFRSSSPQSEVGHTHLSGLRTGPGPNDKCQ